MKRIDSFSDKVCLVTGASAGIGREIARLLAKEGAHLVLTARRRDRLEGLAEEVRSLGAVAVNILPLDLAAPEAAQTLVEKTLEVVDRVDVLINNAGFAVPGLYVRADAARTVSMLQLNVVAAHSLMRAFLPTMVRRGEGAILNVASIAGYQCAPYQAAYAGTKAFLLNLSNGVHQEVKHTGVHVTALNPGVTDTEFFEAAGYKNLTGFMTWRMPADRVARTGIKALKKGKMEVVPGFLNNTLLFTQRFLPRSWVAAMSRRILGGRKKALA